MSKIAELLYPSPPMINSVGSLLRWWESRRLFYNKAVGAAGMVTLTGITLVSTFVLGQGPPPAPLVVGAAVAWAVMANACFSLGFFIELLARGLWKNRAPRLGPLLFREGLIFSVGLTLLPFGLAAILAVAQVVMRVLGFLA